MLSLTRFEDLQTYETKSDEFKVIHLAPVWSVGIGVVNVNSKTLTSDFVITIWLLRSFGLFYEKVNSVDMLGKKD